MIRTLYYFRADCEKQTKGFSGPIFKKFKSNQEAQAFIEGQPEAKKQKTDKQTKISFAKAINKARNATTNENDSEDEAFLNLPEYPDEPDEQNNTKPSSSTSSLKRKDPRAIKYELPEPTTDKIYKSLKFKEDSKGFVHVYTDGSCEGNGKYTAAAGLGVYYGENHPMNVSDPVRGKPTNNAGEIQAAIRAIQDTQNVGIKKLNIHTDSQFLINSACKWMSSWKRKDWRLATGKKVVNEIDFKQLDGLIENGNMVIKWSYVPAHSGHPGNEEADRLAKIGAGLFRNKKKDSETDEFDL